MLTNMQRCSQPRSRRSSGCKKTASQILWLKRHGNAASERGSRPPDGEIGNLTQSTRPAAERMALARTARQQQTHARRPRLRQSSESRIAHARRRWARSSGRSFRAKAATARRRRTAALAQRRVCRLRTSAGDRPGAGGVRRLTIKAAGKRPLPLIRNEKFAPLPGFSREARKRVRVPLPLATSPCP